MAPDVVLQDFKQNRPPDRRMDDAVQDRPVPHAGGCGAEDAPAQSGTIERAAAPGGSGVCRIGCIGVFRFSGEEEVGCCGCEVLDNGVVAAGAGLDDLAGEEVGVDDWEGVGGLGEEV